MSARIAPPEAFDGTRGRLQPPTWLRAGVAAIFGLLARVRRDRAIHTRGVTRSGTAHLRDDGLALSDQPTTDVVVRFSRGAGLPARLPDVNGLAIRFLTSDGHHDLLFATAGPGRLRRILTPAIDFATDRYSTIARYRFQGRPAVLTAELVGNDLTLDDLADSRPHRLELHAHHRSGHTHHVGTIEVGPPVDGSHIRYDPTATGPHLTPLGPVNALRPRAYAASRAQSRK